MKNKWLNWAGKWYIREPILFVIIYFIFMGTDETMVEGQPYYVELLCSFCILYAHAQVNQYLILPYWLDHGRFRFFLLLTLANLLLFSALFYWIDQRLFETIYNKYPQTRPDFWGSVTLHIMSLMVISSIAFIRRMYEKERRDNEIKLLVNQLEINQLKAQINPHFLFNTLNNLYGVSLEQPQRTPDLILRLSQLMRYQMEAGQKEKVALKEELDFIDNFIALETERVGQRCTSRIERSLAEAEFTIAPMLLIPLVENAFKHGTATADRCWVRIDLRLETSGLFKMHICNSTPAKIKPVTSTGVGLENTRLRLEKLYPRRYALQTSRTQTTFDVHLSLQLSK
jgi:two-component system, LytTR family, sensor kinase